MSGDPTTYDGVSDATLSAKQTTATHQGDDMAATARPLPGEFEPLPPRRGGPPPTADEALGMGRRLARERQARSRNPESIEIPDVLPYPEQVGETPLLSVRVDKRTQWFAHANASMERRDLSDVIRAFLREYGTNPPGCELVFVPPGKRVVLVDEEA